MLAADGSGSVGLWSTRIAKRHGSCETVTQIRLTPWSKRIVGVYAHGANDCDVPKALEKYADDVRGWNSEAVVDAILGRTNEWQEPSGQLRDPRPIKRYGCAS